MSSLSVQQFLSGSWVTAGLASVVLGVNRKTVYRRARHQGAFSFFMGQGFLASSWVHDWLSMRSHGLDLVGASLSRQGGQGVKGVGRSFAAAGGIQRARGLRIVPAGRVHLLRQQDRTSKKQTSPVLASIGASGGA